VPIARTDREAEPAIKPGGSIEVAHRMDDVVDATRHIVPSLPGLTRQSTVVVSERKRPMHARVKPAHDDC